jgi:large subunit ribosomal protein L4e
MQGKILSTNGSEEKQITLPEAFSEEVREDLILRAVLSERSYKLQPQGHSILAGMQTTATYYGAMHSYRSGRHMGVAIRPRQKLGGGVQGMVRRIPSSVKGKRAHPHMIEKKLYEKMNKREYQKAIASAVAATASEKHTRHKHTPIIVASGIDSVKKTKDMVAIFRNVGLGQILDDSKDKKHSKPGIRRGAVQRKYKKSILLVVGNDNGAIKAARNIAGSDACTVEHLTAESLAPGGIPGRTTVWSEAAIHKLESAITALNPPGFLNGEKKPATPSKTV